MMPPKRRSTIRGQHGFISRSFMLAIVFFALLGILVIDGGSWAFQNFQMHDAAAVGAREAATVILKSGTPDQACKAAQAAVIEHNSSLELNCEAEDFEVLKSGEVAVTLRKTIPTVVIGHFGPTKEWADLVVVETAEASPF